VKTYIHYILGKLYAKFMSCFWFELYISRSAESCSKIHVVFFLPNFVLDIRAKLVREVGDIIFAVV